MSIEQAAWARESTLPFYRKDVPRRIRLAGIQDQYSGRHFNLTPQIVKRVRRIQPGEHIAAVGCFDTTEREPSAAVSRIQRGGGWREAAHRWVATGPV